MSADITPLFAGERLDRAEVVVGLVGAMGTDMERVANDLAAAFVSVAYSVENVRISALIRDFMSSESVDIPPVGDRTKLDELMDLGDALRESLNHGGATSVLAIGKIKKNRAGREPPKTQAGGRPNDTTGSSVDQDGLSSAEQERQAVATIVRQLKHPQEVEVFRSIYGPRFVLLGIWSPDAEREAAVDRRLRDEHPGMVEDWYAQHVRRLLIRDEKDTKKSLGQRVRETYELADAFVSVAPGQDVTGQIGRFVRLLFGSPYETPTEDEHAMFVAAGTSLRSSDAGRQVGAVVTDEDGEVLVSGTNEIPKPGGGQYWVGDDPDLRDFRIGYDENARQKTEIITKILRSLQRREWLSPDLTATPEQLARDAMAKDGPLAASRVGDLLEFARVAHAEMALISTAARRGTALAGRTMYTTTYPCHECARLIIAAGIRRVIYVDPYPKSQVRTMYAREVADTESKKHVAFQPFSGVAPRMYRSVFQMTGRGREAVSGKYLPWRPEASLPRLVADAALLNNLPAAEDQFYVAAFDLLLNTSWDDVIERAFKQDRDDDTVASS